MDNVNLDRDEVVILEEPDVEAYFGETDDYTYVSKLVLTNKRIFGTYEVKKRTEMFEIKMSDIKQYQNEVQVGYYEHDYGGDCLRVQAIDKNYYFSIDDENESFLGNLKKTFAKANNVCNNKRILLWIEKIKGIIASSKDNSSNVKSEPDNNEKTFVVGVASTNDTITCSSCGKSFDSNSRFCPFCGKPVAVEKEKVIEVVRCRKCGAKIDIDTKFCPSCGTSVIEKEEPAKEKEEPIKEEKQSASVGERCSGCGYLISSDMVRCPQCGLEIRGRKAVSSVKDFAKEISSIDDIGKKAEAIKMFPIPNNKEDITEFMYLATSNFDVKKYMNDKNADIINSAWYVKIEQCYTKAKGLFNQNDLEIINKLYFDIKNQTEIIGKRQLILKIVGIALIVLSCIMMGVLPRNADGSITVAHYIFFGLLVGGIVVTVFGFKKAKK